MRTATRLLLLCCGAMLACNGAGAQSAAQPAPQQGTGQGAERQAGQAQPMGAADATSSVNSTVNQAGVGAGVGGALSGDQAAVAASNVRIGSGDLVEIAVFGAPDLSGRFRVSDMGNIDLPVTGQVHVINLDAESAARLIERRLKDADIMKSPVVQVFVLEYASQGVTLIGDVRSPGVYPILGSRRLMDVLASAGGLSMTAGKDIRIQHRDDYEHPEIVTIDNVTVTPTRNPVIQAGDMITVPRSGVVYLLGALGHPGGFLVENNNRLDLLKLVALAGGPTRTAGLAKTRLIRTTATGRVEMDINLQQIMEGKRQSIMLQDSDIVYVPDSEKRYLMYRGIEAAIQTGTGFLLYRTF